MNKLPLASALLLLGLGGCHDNSTPADASAQEARLAHVTNLKQLEAEIKRNLTYLGSLDAEPAAISIPDDAETTGDSGGSGAGNFSTTNVQEAGVDESDLVKYDGRYLYAATQSYNYFILDDALPGATEYDGNVGIRVLETQAAPAAAVERATVTLGQQRIMGMYLNNENEANKQLAVLSSQYQWEYDTWYDFGLWGGQSTFQIDLVNVSDPVHSSKTWSVSIDGTYVDSRRIDNKLYVVSRYYPQIDTFQPYPDSEAVAQQNADIVAALDINSLLPERRINAGDPEPHITAENCLVPDGKLKDNTYLPFILTVTTIDLNNPAAMNVTCMVGEDSGVYASHDNLYLFDQSHWEHTVIHKFGFTDDGTEYLASGEISGSPGWSNPHLRFSEYNGDLRVVTSDSDMTHHLYVLRETSDSAGRLTTIATLPNSERPAPIGKPNEALYAVRFLGNRAYAVTFQSIDPLYVIDLSDPLAPSIAGELELPGFSDYLQPVGDHLLLGVGKQAVTVDGTTVTQGVKIGLFDTTNISSPQVLHEEVIGKRGSDSAAGYDYHALSILKLPDSEHYRIALPVMVADGTPSWGEGEAAYYPWQSSIFRLFDIDAGASTPTMESTGDLTVDVVSESNSWASQYFFRSVIDGDTVHAVYGDRVWSAAWDAPEEANGPQ